jgi:hypothetical protein
MSDYNFLATLLATIFGFVAMVSNVYSAYWQRRSAMMAIDAQGPENRPNVISQSAWWKNSIRYRIVFTVLLSLGAIYFKQNE